MGVALFLVSLTALLGAGMVGYVVIRLRAETWPPEGVSLPGAIWFSTALLLGVSVALLAGLRGIRRGSAPALSLGLAAAALLAVGFLASQAFVATTLLDALGDRVRGLFAFCFFFLTGLHAIHVVGGLIPLLLTVRRAFKGKYTAESHTGARLIALYWHFLDVVWLVMLALLLV